MQSLEFLSIEIRLIVWFPKIYYVYSLGRNMREGNIDREIYLALPTTCEAIGLELWLLKATFIWHMVARQPAC